MAHIRRPGHLVHFEIAKRYQFATNYVILTAEVEVELLHGDDLAVATAGGAAL